ncbi:expressed unknown protein [Seminavis robusta]|uniref:Uncharacterized protein n=1 Tax=Seminavis robusta TaxID=568900 RepID=A0A9N8EAI7_9STRA|nr:expressed unknown protein [Seminavis robusta]|eukprot:Sro864_g212700.1 n/a (826) ;mRNA; f:38306-41076
MMMKIPLILLKTCSFLALTTIVSAVNSNGCISSLNTIYEAERKVQDDSVLRKYILCNDTEFHVALNFASDGSPLDGQYPIPIARPNVQVLCGENGSSDNNCQIVRGLVHVGIVDEFGDGTRADNILLQGLTFFRATSVNVIAMIGGDITIRDCVFKRNRNVASVYAVAPSSNTRKLLSSENSNLVDYLEHDRRGGFKRALQRNATKTQLHVTITDCVFSDNVLGASPGADTTAIVYSVGASIDMSKSVIVGTTKDLLQQPEDALGHLIYVESAPVVLRDNCFIGNQDDIAPVVATSATVDADNNFNQRTSSTLSSTNCEFIAHNTTLSASGAGFVCEPSDAQVCATKSSSTYRVPCVGYLDDIYFSEFDVIDSSLPRTYLLCSDTVFRVGSRHEVDGTPIGGSYPIVLGRSNVRVLCGVDGKVENGCSVVNGVVQVAHFDEFQTGGLPIFKSLVSGVTFSGASAINALVSGAGDVTFRDCIFKDNSNVGNVYVQVLPPSISGRRSLRSAIQSVTMASDDNRRLSRTESVDPDTLVARFDGCVFVNNTIGTSTNPISGLITNKEATLEMSNTMIIDTVNHASHDYMGYYEVGYLVGNFNGDVNLDNNCFYDNHVTIAPVINQGRLLAVSNSGRQQMASPNNNTRPQALAGKLSRSGNADEHLLVTSEQNVTSNATLPARPPGWGIPIDHENARCAFIATIHGDEYALGSVNPEVIELTCEVFDTDQCINPSAPTSAPSMFPSMSPEPSSAPTDSSSMPSLAPTAITTTIQSQSGPDRLPAENNGEARPQSTSSATGDSTTSMAASNVVASYSLHFAAILSLYILIA